VRKWWYGRRREDPLPMATAELWSSGELGGDGELGLLRRRRRRRRMLQTLP
jgi:hypothetical protein